MEPISLIGVKEGKTVPARVAAKFNVMVPEIMHLNICLTLKEKIQYCADPSISLHSHHVSLVQWTTCLLPDTRDSG
jgi:hypothetical protein